MATLEPTGRQASVRISADSQPGRAVAARARNAVAYRISPYGVNLPSGMSMTATPLTDILEARPLAIFGDSITTDHISPAGAIKLDSPAGEYLIELNARSEGGSSAQELIAFRVGR